MKSTVETQSGLYRKLTVEVPVDKVSSSFDRVYRGIQKNATIKGFRKGKAPLNVIKSIYGDSVKGDVLQDLFAEGYRHAIKEHNLQPVTQPQIDFEALNEGSPFKFTAVFEVHPEVNVTKFEKLKVEKEKWELDDKTIDNILESYREQFAELVPVFEERPAQLGDIAVIDFVGKLDGTPFPGGEGQDYNLELGSKSFIEGFEDGVVGMTVGAQKSLNLRFPDDYTPDLAGKDVVFDVTLKALKKKSLPELNDEFAKKLGGFNTLDELRKDIADRVTEQETRRIRNDLHSRIIQALVKENPVEIPEQIHQEEMKAMMDDAWKNLRQRGMTESQFEEYKQKWEKEFSDVAAVKVKANFLIVALAEKLGMTVTNEEVDARIQKYAQQVGLEPQKVRDFYSRNGSLSGLQYQILEEKVVEHLIKTADITEVPRDKLKE